MVEYPKTVKIKAERYIFFSVGVPLVIVFLIIIMAFITHGLFEHYLDKKVAMRHFAKIVARSAALEDFKLVEVQVQQSVSQDPVLMDLQFYSIDQKVEFDEHAYNDWQNALLNDSISFYEGVMVKVHEHGQVTAIDPDFDVADQLSSNMHSNFHELIEHDHGESGNTALVGYINVTIDLQKLRQEWFERNLIALMSLITILLAFLVLIYLRLRLPIKQIVNMADKAKYIMSQDELDLRPIVYNEKGFDELEVIRQLIVILDRRYKELNHEYDDLKRVGSDSKGQRQSQTYNSNLKSTIIHELKSSLNDISDGLRLMDNHYISNEQSEAIDKIRKGSKELDFKLNQIIMLDLIEKGLVGVSVSELQPVQLINNLVQDYEDIAAKRGLDLKVNIDHFDQVLAGDVKKIHSILEELLTNAIKYTKSGSITLHSKIDYFKDTIRWTVQIKDTGIGIEQNQLEDIFQPFFRGNPDHKLDKDNRGIGLGVAYKLTQLLNGELTVKSAKDKGTEFTLTLQLRDWRTDEQFRLLAGINIVVLATNDTVNCTKVLERYGASTHLFTDKFALNEHLIVNSEDILLIANTFSVDSVRELCLSIRSQEHASRILIAWYNKTEDAKQQAILESNGLDYIINPDTPYKDQAEMMKSWMMR